MLDRAWHDRLFKVTHFIGPFEFQTNDSPKRRFVQALNNPINIFKINPNIIYVSFIKYLWISTILVVSIAL